MTVGDSREDRRIEAHVVASTDRTSPWYIGCVSMTSHKTCSDCFALPFLSCNMHFPALSLLLYEPDLKDTGTVCISRVNHSYTGSLLKGHSMLTVVFLWQLFGDLRMVCISKNAQKCGLSSLRARATMSIGDGRAALRMEVGLLVLPGLLFWLFSGGLDKSLQVLLGGIEAVVALTLIILK